MLFRDEVEDVVGDGDVFLEVDDFDDGFLAALLDDGFQRETLVGPDGPFDGFAVRDDDVEVFVAGLAHILFFAKVLEAIFFGQFVGDIQEIEVGHRVGRLFTVDFPFLDVECPDAVLPGKDAVVIGDEAGNVHCLDVAFESAIVVDIDSALDHLPFGGGLLFGNARLEAVFLERVLGRSAEGDGEHQADDEEFLHSG